MSFAPLCANGVWRTLSRYPRGTRRRPHLKAERTVGRRGAVPGQPIRVDTDDIRRVATGQSGPQYECFFAVLLGGRQEVRGVEGSARRRIF